MATVRVTPKREGKKPEALTISIFVIFILTNITLIYKWRNEFMKWSFQSPFISYILRSVELNIYLLVCKNNLLKLLGSVVFLAEYNKQQFIEQIFNFQGKNK